uniref:Cytochrome c oxidase subunit 5B, mitochondrial n=1 Tax=Phallusia mammillata TaxID=59560 RepID=A0A6F9DA24_9ASCI|nr:cytochrome c oxidase subunit 5B, mitochondrial [Phallusia mammillata]
MALRKFTQVALQSVFRTQSARAVHISVPRKAILEDKPWPDEGAAVGYEKVVMDAAKVGEDPLEVFNRETPYPFQGAGTKDDPIVIPSRNKTRYVMTNPPNWEGGPPVGTWVTLEEGGRCPATGKHYKLNYDPSDKWGINELDLFMH